MVTHHSDNSDCPKQKCELTANQNRIDNDNDIIIIINVDDDDDDDDDNLMDSQAPLQSPCPLPHRRLLDGAVCLIAHQQETLP
jgi:hypothetical protein